MILLVKVAYFLIWLFIIILFGRVVIDLVRSLARDWQPKGFSLIVCEAIYTVTDPPLKGLRRIVPPLSIGQVRLDLAFLVLLLSCYTIMYLLDVVARGLN